MSFITPFVYLEDVSATRVKVAQQPSSAVAGVPLPRQPVVWLTDAEGKRPVEGKAIVKAQLVSNGIDPSIKAGALGGTVEVETSAAGVAAFSDLFVTDANNDYVLHFSVVRPLSLARLPVVASSPFSIVSGPVFGPQFRRGPPREVAIGTSFNVVVELTDEWGNSAEWFPPQQSVTSNAGVQEYAPIDTAEGEIYLELVIPQKENRAGENDDGPHTPQMVPSDARLTAPENAPPSAQKLRKGLMKFTDLRVDGNFASGEFQLQVTCSTCRRTQVLSDIFRVSATSVVRISSCPVLYEDPTLLLDVLEEVSTLSSYDGTYAKCSYKVSLWSVGVGGAENKEGRPKNNVVVSVSSIRLNDPMVESEAEEDRPGARSNGARKRIRVSPEKLTFTPENYSIPQYISVEVIHFSDDSAKYRRSRRMIDNHQLPLDCAEHLTIFPH